MAVINTRRGKPKHDVMRCLLDSGTTSTLVLKKFVKKLRLKPATKRTWMTRGGKFSTTKTTTAKFRLPELHNEREIEWKVHVDESKSPEDTNYDMIIGGDLLIQLGIDITYSKKIIQWDGATLPMRSIDLLTQKTAYDQAIEDLYESEIVQDSTERIKRILDAHYEKADLDKLTASYTHLQETERNELNQLLKKYEYLFDGTLGKWKTEPIDIELKENVNPYHAKPFPVP